MCGFLQALDNESPEGKVKIATNNEPWGPTGTQKSELADMSFGTEVGQIYEKLRKHRTSATPVPRVVRSLYPSASMI